MSTDHERTLLVEREVARINTFFPLMPTLGNRWAARRPWEDRVVALNLHLTSLTAALVTEMTLGGGRFVVSAANPATTDAGVVAFLRSQGITVHTGADGADRHADVLATQPQLVADVGFELVERGLTSGAARSFTGVAEVTRSGIHRLRALERPPTFPVLNLDEGKLKPAVENRHGVGEGIWQAVARLTGIHLSGRRVAILGYGPVGRGLAAYGRANGMSVEVVEQDPIRRLFAHYDGYPTPSLDDALRRVGVVVTATGRAGALSVEHLAKVGDGTVLVNAGHGGDEIDMAGLRARAARVDHVTEGVVNFQLPSGSRVTVLGDGHPLNIVLNSGSPEPVLLQFAVLGLALEWLATEGDVAPGESVVPVAIEEEAAALALAALESQGA